MADPGDILDNPQLPIYQLVYGLSTLLLIFMSICFSWVFTKLMRKASTTLHSNLLSKVWVWVAAAAAGCALALPAFLSFF